MIYYIYKVRRKQTPIRFSRSALPHRYLRSISWISWNGHRPPPDISWVFPRLVPQLRPRIFAAVPIPQGRGSCAPAAITTQKVKKGSPDLSPQEKEDYLSSHPHTPLLLCCFAYKLLARAASDPSAAGPSPAPTSLSAASHKQKMRARGIAPRTRSSRLSNVLKKA